MQLFAFLAAWAIVVVARLVQIQIVRHDHYVAKAKAQHERTLVLNPVRGSIIDARGRILAESVAAESIYADPQVITDHRATAKSLASVPGIGLTAREIDDKLRGNGAFAWIARQLPLDVAAEARKLKLNGIYFLDEHRRSYPRGTLAANVIGYAGVDGQGLGGAELSLDAHVRGTPGKVTLLRDARRNMYLVGGEGPNRPRDGHHVVLTIDSVVQFITERALAKAVEQYHAAGGSAIVLDPNDGAILAMASLPTFDPNHFGDFSQLAFHNRNVQDLYEPGSTFKIVTASAGLEEGVVTPSQILDCNNGAITIANVTIHEHGNNHYGLMTFEDVMVHSSNVGAVRVSNALGDERFYNYIRRFGFGEKTGLPLPAEATGILRTTRRWTPISHASISIGQEISVTPIQVVRAVATVANGGVRVEPRILERVIDDSGKTIVQPERAQPVRVISEKTAAVLNEILKQVVSRGTGENAALDEHIVAGKTGTAQKSAGRAGYSADKFVASFAGYVPADRPRLVILVVIDEPRGAQYGGTVAAPAFREIAEATLRYLGVAPSIPSRSIGVHTPQLAAFSQHPTATPASAVPDLRGLDARAAIARAVGSGLEVRAIGSGVVTSQHPEPGEALPEDRRVTLTLSEARS
ncbi:MAG TPA: penicillin-binding protein [Thermoanaerobaculia bacterium]|nr:penicillin-binding protein [Thermoanaerobaculia bacterium]